MSDNIFPRWNFNSANTTGLVAYRALMGLRSGHSPSVPTSKRFRPLMVTHIWLFRHPVPHTVDVDP